MSALLKVTILQAMMKRYKVGGMAGRGAALPAMMLREREIYADCYAATPTLRHANTITAASLRHCRHYIRYATPC